MAKEALIEIKKGQVGRGTEDRRVAECLGNSYRDVDHQNTDRGDVDHLSEGGDAVIICQYDKRKCHHVS